MSTWWSVLASPRMGGSVRSRLATIWTLSAASGFCMSCRHSSTTALRSSGTRSPGAWRAPERGQLLVLVEHLALALQLRLDALALGDVSDERDGHPPVGERHVAEADLD